MTDAVAPPPGYAALRGPHAEGAARLDIVSAVDAILATGQTLHQWAAAQPGTRAMHGRGVLWALPLGGLATVVRHVWHGGMFAPLTRDLHVSPTRAPGELALALALSQRKVPTPDVLAYATYRAPFGLRRADVVTAELVGGEDLLAALIRADAAEREGSLVPAVGELLAALKAAGAWHPDLNLKNILLTAVPPRVHKAFVLDVDVVRLGTPGDAGFAQRNLDRLVRSAVKRRREMRSPVTGNDLRAWSRAIA